MCRCSGKVYFGRKFDNDQEQPGFFAEKEFTLNNYERKLLRTYFLGTC